MEACLGKMKAMKEIDQEPIDTELKTGLETVKATDFEANPEETEAVAEQ
jgi:hypothetical protein